jgi:hypothetical protein
MIERKRGYRRICMALSVAIDGLSDRRLSEYLDSFRAAGVDTIDGVREACREARRVGLEVFPPCDHTDERGRCLGHPVVDEAALAIAEVP